MDHNINKAGNYFNTSSNMRDTADRIDAVIFDFDGTLTDYMDADRRAIKYVHALTGTSVPFHDFFILSVDSLMTFHRLVDEAQIDPLTMNHYRLSTTFAAYAIPWGAHYPARYTRALRQFCVPFAGTAQMLSHIRSKVKLGIISNAYDAIEQHRRVRSSGLAHYFNKILVAGDIGVYKPDPAIYLHLLDALHVTPGHALFVGDSIEYDIRGAHSAGMQTVLLRHTLSSDSDNADYTVVGTNELHLLLGKLIRDH